MRALFAILAVLLSVTALAGVQEGLDALRRGDYGRARRTSTPEWASSSTVPPSARWLSLQFETDVLLTAYEVRLASDGSLEWIDRAASGETRLASEPGATAANQAPIELMMALPIEWLL
jgi:hypothetical protein